MAELISTTTKTDHNGSSLRIKQRWKSNSKNQRDQDGFLAGIHSNPY